MSGTVELEAAALEARAARERLLGTANELKVRLEPPRLIDDAVNGAKAGAVGLMQHASDAAIRRPRATLATIGGLLLVVGRKRIGRGIGRIFRRRRRRDRGDDY